MAWSTLKLAQNLQFVTFKPLSYCFQETKGFNVKVSFASRSVLRLIRWCNKPGDITKEFWEKVIQLHGTFHGLKITNCFGERDQNGQKYFRGRTIFHDFEHSSLPTRSWRKTKTIVHATKNYSLIICDHFCLTHALICPKTWGKRPKWSKILKSHRFS